MKFVALAILCLSFAVSANTVESVFSPKSELPELLKAPVLEVVAEKFPCLQRNSLKEVSTVQYVIQDRSFYFITYLRANYHYDYHPRTTTITIVSSMDDYSCTEDCDTQVEIEHTNSPICE
jgi:hypothetical protein